MKRVSKIVISIMLVFALCATTLMVPMTSVDAASKKITLIKGVSIPKPSGYTSLTKESGVCMLAANKSTNSDASMILALAKKDNSLKGVNVTNKVSVKLLKQMLKNDSSLKSMGIKNVTTKIIKTKAGKAVSFSGKVTSQGYTFTVKGFMIVKNSKIVIVENVYTNGLKSVASKSMKTIQKGILVK